MIGMSFHAGRVHHQQASHQEDHPTLEENNATGANIVREQEWYGKSGTARQSCSSKNALSQRGGRLVDVSRLVKSREYVCLMFWRETTCVRNRRGRIRDLRAKPVDI